MVLDNRMGGPQVRVLSVARELRKRGIETVMLAPDGAGDFTSRARREGFRAHQVQLRNPKTGVGPEAVWANVVWLLTFPVAVFAVRRVVRKEHADVVHVNGLLGLHAALGGRLAGRKVVWHLIGAIYPRWLLIVLVPVVRLLAARIVVISGAMGRYYLGAKHALPAERAVIIHEPVDTDRFDPGRVSAAERDAVRSALGVGPEERVVGCVGNINPVKGYEYFLRAASLVRGRLKGVKFVIAGASLDSQKAYHATLVGLVGSLGMGKDVIFAGYRDDIPAVLSVFDVYVLPSVAEGTPIAVLEAMAMGKPVVATGVGGVADQVVDGESGIIVPPRDPESLAGAVVRLLSDRGFAADLGRRARERVCQQFSLDRCVEGHVRLYDAVAR